MAWSYLKHNAHFNDYVFLETMVIIIAQYQCYDIIQLIDQLRLPINTLYYKSTLTAWNRYPFARCGEMYTLKIVSDYKIEVSVTVNIIKHPFLLNLYAELFGETVNIHLHFLTFLATHGDRRMDVYYR